MSMRWCAPCPRARSPESATRHHNSRISTARKDARIRSICPTATWDKSQCGAGNSQRNVASQTNRSAREECRMKRILTTLAIGALLLAGCATTVDYPYYHYHGYVGPGEIGYHYSNRY